MPGAAPRGWLAAMLNGVLLAAVAAGYGLWFGCRLAWGGLCLPWRLARRWRAGKRG